MKNEFQPWQQILTSTYNRAETGNGRGVAAYSIKAFPKT